MIVYDIYISNIIQQWKHPDYCVISDTFVSDSFSVDSFLASPLGLKTREIPYMELFFWDDPHEGGSKSSAHLVG